MIFIRSKIIPLLRKDIDTDLIIPGQFLAITTKAGLGKHVFSRLREMEPDFPFNLDKYQNAEILVTRDNFGCGSSREHAVWALKDWGIKVIIAPSFADIFFENSLKNGLLPVVLPSDVVEKIFKKERKSGKFELIVNLAEQTVTQESGEIFDFQIDPYRKECLQNNMDDLDYLLAKIPEIRKFQLHHQKHLFFNVDKA